MNRKTAAKFLDDHYASNKQWALVGDLSTRELNTLELAMLSALDFQLFVTREEYNTSVRMLWDLLPTTPSPVAHPTHAEPSRPLARGGRAVEGSREPHDAQHALSPRKDKDVFVNRTTGVEEAPACNRVPAVEQQTRQHSEAFPGCDKRHAAESRGGEYTVEHCVSSLRGTQQGRVSQGAPESDGAAGIDRRRRPQTVTTVTRAAEIQSAGPGLPSPFKPLTTGTCKSVRREMTRVEDYLRNGYGTL